MLRRLAAGLAHNVNNALTGVIGYLELTLRQAPAGSEAFVHLQGALACAHKAAGAVRQVLSFACGAPHAGNLGPVSLRALAERTVERLPVRGGPLPRVILTGASPAWVRGSEELLQLALDQVVANSIEALAGDGTLALTLVEEDDRVCLRVGDTAGGLPAEVRDHLFEPFLTTKFTGHLGLGLVLCRQLVEAQGGTLDVRSMEGQGTTVTFSFPVPIDPTGDPALRLDGGQALAPAPHVSPAVRPLVRQPV
jgi:signal transduction histidine kinase